MGIYIYNENIKKKYKYFIKKNFFFCMCTKCIIIIVYNKVYSITIEKDSITIGKKLLIKTHFFRYIKYKYGIKKKIICLLCKDKRTESKKVRK